MEQIVEFINSNALYLCIILSVVLHFLMLNRRKKELKINSFWIFSFFGTVYFAPIFYICVALILKLDVKKVLDISTPAVLISAFCCRLNCMFEGCCTGIEILNTGIKVPTREIELSCYLAILMLIIYKEKRNTLKLRNSISNIFNNIWSNSYDRRTF